MIYFHKVHNKWSIEATEAFRNAHFNTDYLVDNNVANEINTNNMNDENADQSHRIAGLSCEKYGGLSDDLVKELVYWEDIPSDAAYASPFRDTGKYLTFEPDEGGWNNIRMAMETILVLAHAMGRTLVLPPEKRIYLLGSDKFSFNDFFHLESLHLEHENFDIITMEEFLKREGITGNLVDETTNEALKPPRNQVQWDGKDLAPLFDYLRRVGHFDTSWDPLKCMAAIPATKDEADIVKLQDMLEEIKKLPPDRLNPDAFTGKYAEADGPAFERLKENLGQRPNLCIYDKTMQEKTLVHFQVDRRNHDRMLTHFYAFVFFQDWRQDLWTKRFIRDHVRYLDEVFCAAGKIINAVRERARKHNPTNTDGIYDSFHVRRGDFQYKRTRLSAEELLKVSQPHLQEGTTLFISTDEKDKSFFEPLAKEYDVSFLSDYMDLVKGLPPNYFGMVDQIIASRGNVFFGTWFSSFSGYINRMRGYRSVKDQLEGYKDGKTLSWYFYPDDRHEEMREYRSVRRPIYMREFPTSWRDIDKGIGDV